MSRNPMTSSPTTKRTWPNSRRGRSWCKKTKTSPPPGGCRPRCTCTNSRTFLWRMSSTGTMLIVWCKRLAPGNKETRRRIPGHALHEKGLQRQISVRTLDSNHERRAVVVPEINRGYTAGQPRVLFLHRFMLDFACWCFQIQAQESCLRFPGS